MTGRTVALTALIALGVILAIELAANMGFDVRGFLPRRGGSTSGANAGENVRDAVMGGNNTES